MIARTLMVNAVEIMNYLKGKANYKHIPVVVLSGSVKKDTIVECYAAWSNSFIQKPCKVKETDENLKLLPLLYETVMLP